MTDESVAESVVTVERIDSMVAFWLGWRCTLVRDSRWAHLAHASTFPSLRRADPSPIASLPCVICEQSSVYTLIYKIREIWNVRRWERPPFMLFSFDLGSFAVEKKSRCPSSTPNLSDQ